MKFRKENMCFFIIFFCILISNINAQHLDFGMRIGENLSQFYGSPNPPNSYANTIHPYSYKNGIVIGFQSDYWLNQYFSITSQMLYVETGGATTFIGPGIEGFYDDFIFATANYLEVPIEIEYRWFKNSGLMPYIFLGMTLDYLVYASYTTPREYDSKTRDYKTEQIDETKRASSTVFGILGGLGLDYVFNSNYTFFVDASYRFRTTNIGIEEYKGINDLRLCGGILFAIF